MGPPAPMAPTSPTSHIAFIPIFAPSIGSLPPLPIPIAYKKVGVTGS